MRNIRSIFQEFGRGRLVNAAIARDLDAIKDRLETQSHQIGTLEKNIMAQLSDVFAAIEQTGTLIIEKVNAEAAEIVAAIEKAKVGASAADFDAIIAKVNTLGSTVGDAVTGLIPTVETPVVATPAVDPVKVLEAEEVDLPAVDLPVTITDSTIGVDGGKAIDPE